jgi:hypothetical protein
MDQYYNMAQGSSFHFGPTVTYNTNILMHCKYIFGSFQVITLKENDLYTTSNFMADVGGYMGLLLGASMLSIYDEAIRLLGILLDKTKYHYFKNI